MSSITPFSRFAETNASTLLRYTGTDASVEIPRNDNIRRRGRI